MSGAESLHHKICFMDWKNKLLLILKKSLDKCDFMFTMHTFMGFKIQSHGDNQKIYLFELIKIFF